MTEAIIITVPQETVIEQTVNTGFRGRDVYEVAVDNGFDGTEAEWLKAQGLYGARPPTVPFVKDDFERPDGRLGPGWIDGKDVYPQNWEPLGVSSGGLVCADPRTRPVNYATAVDARGIAWRDMGSRDVRIQWIWTGNKTGTTMAFAGALIGMNPEDASGGFQIMPGLFGNTTVLYMGTMGITPELGTITHTASGITTQTSGTPITFEVTVVNGAFTVSANGVQLSVNAQSGTNPGLNPVPLPTASAYSTAHGFSVDASANTSLASIPTAKAMNYFEMEALDPGAGIPRSAVEGLDGFQEMTDAINSLPELAAGSNMTLTTVAGLTTVATELVFADKAVTKYALATSDVARTNQTIADDSQLFVTVDANAKYIVEGCIFYTGDATADLRMSWSGPTGATFVWSPHGRETANATTETAATVYSVGATITSEMFVGAVGVSTQLAAFPKGILETSTTAGTFKFRWAQVTTNGGAATTRKAKSYIKLTRIV
jgi:hypothetical protein